MVEIPPELEEEIPHLKATIDAFSEQLQVISEMRDAIHELFIGGHFQFQANYTERHPFDTAGLESLQSSLSNLHGHIKRWNVIQKAARSEFYFMNYFTMREVSNAHSFLLLVRVLMFDLVQVYESTYNPHHGQLYCTPAGTSNDHSARLGYRTRDCTLQVVGQLSGYHDEDDWKEICCTN